MQNTQSNIVRAFELSRVNKTAILDMKREEVDLIQWDSPVHVEKLFTRSGVESNLFAVVATDPMTAKQYHVGQYAKGDSLLANRDCALATESALERLGWTYTRKISVVRGGSGFTITYTITNFPMTIGHSQAMPQIRIKNSYDGKWKFEGELLMMILVCLNGMMGLAPVKNLSEKHSSKLNLSDLTGKLESLFSEGRAGAADFEKLENFGIKDDVAALNLFGNVAAVSKGGISKRLAGEMLSSYLNPDAPEMTLAPTLWRAYMAATRTLRDLETVRPTAAASANEALGQIFGLVARKSTFGGDSAAQTLFRPTPAAFALVEI